MERFAYEISWLTPRISALTFLVCESAKMEVEPAERIYVRVHTYARVLTPVPRGAYNFRNALLG